MYFSEGCFQKNANKRAPGASAGLPKGAAQPRQVMLCPQEADVRWLYWALAGARPDFYFKPFFFPSLGLEKKSMCYPGQRWLLCSYPSCS